ncbi:DUF3768 domain-containing protein [Sphingobium baderi]|uniref:DUF3768 domain-containing protein n=1 Tax=Sphingobium baderi TaxID=1332080 RepID=A0A0S3F5U5_9SPHN|nr:DUF3768 domain-containing protein [Sphingobium baderi]ALR23156.1 hypothetical protein ATN00_21900 [Sphingobium baderi]
MRFQRTPRPEGYAVTPRKIAAFERKKRRQIEALPLFADATAAAQISAADEMERREVSAMNAARDRRAFIARQWREMRADYYGLPRHVRESIADRWRRWTGPATSSCLLHLMKVEGAQATAAPEDYPHISAEDRHARTVYFNRLAREHNNPYARCERIHSPGVLLWLSPFFAPLPDQPEPRLYLTTNLGLHGLLHDALAAFCDFGHNSDPSGEQRAGFFEIEGTTFRFQISYHRHDSDEPSRVPWDTYLTRRILWIGLADERPPHA